MTLKQVKKDLQDIRYYYTHKAMFDKAENTGFKSEAVRKSEEYGQIVSKAPPRLYVLYYLLYVEGKTQYAAATEQNVTDGHILVIGGLTGNERIVRSGVGALTEGEKVRVIERPSETNVGGLL